MKKIYYLLFPCILLTIISINLFGQNCANTANVYQFTHSNKKYEVVKELKSWEDAAACAQQRGGYLAEINSQSENDSIYDAIINDAGVSLNYTSVPDAANQGAYVWIGATDKITEGTWLWNGNNDNTGINFWNGGSGLQGGNPVAGKYHNWGGKSENTIVEPENGNGVQQDAAGMGLSNWLGNIAIGGEWNDINMVNQLYYVIEFDNPPTADFSADQTLICAGDSVSLVTIVS